MSGRSIEDYSAPLFIAWQLTNRCAGRCLACCEDSGPDRGWVDELSRDEALEVTRQIIGAGIPYVAFGGGEPLGVAHAWEVFDRLAAVGVAIKIETDGARVDDAAAERLAGLSVHCLQISVDGATAATHDRMRPGSPFDAAVAALKRAVARGLEPQMVFTPARHNVAEAVQAFDLAVSLGCGAFVTGPMMRLGRAAADWDGLACDDDAWARTVDALKARAVAHPSSTKLSIYPWDIVSELGHQLVEPHAMLLIVPNGKVKILNALPFSPADLRRDTISEAWDAYRRAWRSVEVRDFVAACFRDPSLLRHANETWPLST